VRCQLKTFGVTVRVPYFLLPVGGTLAFELDRLLDTTDTTQDLVWDLCSPQYVIWAQSNTVPTSNTSWSAHSSKGSLSLNLCGTCTAPGVPQQLRSVSLNTSSLRLAWAPATVQPGLRVSYRAKWNCSNSIVQYEGADTTFDVSGLSPGQTCSLSVSAINCLGESPTAYANVSVPAVAPDRPQAPFLLNSTSTTITVGWVLPGSGGSPIRNMSLFFASSVPQSAWRRLYTGSALSFRATGLLPSTAYQFMLSAANAVGNSRNSSIVAFNTSNLEATAPTAPAAPQIVDATHVSLLVAWTAPQDGGSPIVEYSLFFSTSSSGRYLIAYRGRELGANITSLIPSTLYFFTVSARNSIGSSANSSTSSGRTDAPPPVAPPTAPPKAPPPKALPPTFQPKAAPQSAPPKAAIQSPSESTPPVFGRRYNNTLETIGGRLKLSWLIETDSIWFKLECQCTGWVALGIGSSMSRADIIIGSVSNNQVAVNDYWSDTQSAPSLDVDLGGSDSILAYHGFETANTTTVEFQRRLNASDPDYDLSIIPGETNILLAFHETEDDLFYHDSHRDQLKINLNEVALLPLDTNPGQQMKQAHGILMFLTWGAILPIGVIFARYCRSFHSLNRIVPDAWFKIHRAMQICGYIGSLVAAVIAFIVVGSSNHFKTTNGHSQIGLTVMSLGLLQLSLAVFRPPASKFKSRFRILWEYQHILTGVLSLLLSAAAIITGILWFRAPIFLLYLYISWLCALFIVVVVLEIRRRVKGARKFKETESEGL
jgi:hypothetical protein